MWRGCLCAPRSFRPWGFGGYDLGAEFVAPGYHARQLATQAGQGNSARRLRPTRPLSRAVNHNSK